MKHTAKGMHFTDIILDIFRLNGQLILEGDRLSKEFGLSSARWKVLGAIALSQGSITVPQIARNMGQSRQAVQRLANEMEGDSLLIFQNNPHHKRAKLLVLTTKGKDAYKELENKQIPWANSVASTVSEADLRIASSVLRKLIDNSSV